MDYKHTYTRYLFLVFAIILITGCDTEVSPAPLEILGTPPDTLYYDSKFQYTFGVSGGEAPYSVRYIQNPEDEEDEDTNFEENPVEMTIEYVEGPKPTFVLRATPTLPDDIPLSELSSRKLKYQLELTDGSNTILRDYEFTLKPNKLSIVGSQLATEGSVSNTIVTTLTNQLELGQTGVCNQVTDNVYTKRVNESGETVYPYVFQVLTEARTASKTEIFYRFTTGYNEDEPERSLRNVGFARKGVDYVDEIHSIVLEPENATCVAYVDLLEDNIIEGTESLSVEFFDSAGGAIDLSSATAIIDIRDNEIEPRYVTSNIVRNRGDKVVVPITLSRVVEYPVSFNISIDIDETTATDSDFILSPESGVVTLSPGEIESSYTVTILENPDESVSDTLKDKIITITTDMDEILDVEPYTIEINEWARTSDISKEIVGGENATEEVVDFTVDGDGIITTLTRDLVNGNIVTKIKSFNRDASNFNFTSEGSVVLAQSGKDISPISIQTTAEGSSHRLTVVLNVDSLYADVFRGGTDFVVLNYTRDSGDPYTLVSAKQYGSEGNDNVTGSVLKDTTLLVYGNTNGADFEGIPSSESNSGGYDGFIYAIDIVTDSFKWARLIGTSNEDNVVAIDAGNRDVVASVSTSSTDKDIFVRKLNINTGVDIEEDIAATIATNRDDIAADIEFDTSASNFRILLDSDADLNSDNTLTPSLSRDIQLITFDSNNERAGILSIATELDDTAKGLNTMPNNENLIVSGETLGELQGNLKRGNGDIDVFTSVIELENSSNISLTQNIQFGSTTDDSIIALKPASDTKYFVLWKESFTNPLNDTYRISAFSVDGKKLSRDP